MAEHDTTVGWVLEDSGGGYGRGDTTRRAFLSALTTMSLSIMGSSILPTPFAVSRVGVVMGALAMLVVAWANDLTSRLLIHAAAATGHTSYEALAEWAGGRPWKVFTQVSLIGLLWGTLCGGLALISDVGDMAVAMAWQDGTAEGEAPPPWLNGPHVLIGVTLLVLFPICMQRHMRQLERAGTVGVIIVVVLIILLAVRAAQAGFPALVSGELPLFGVAQPRALPEAASIIGYCFYCQPMLMPLLAEMPPGRAGVKIMEKAVRVTMFGVALTVYLATGVFGASLFGLSTPGDIMEARLCTGRAACLTLYGAMAVYLCLGISTGQMALRVSMEIAVFGEGAAPLSTGGLAVFNLLTIGSSLLVALSMPHAAEHIYALVGATAVCIVCYVVPTFVHIRLYQRRSKVFAAVGQPAAVVCGSLAEEAWLVAPLLSAAEQGEAAGAQASEAPEATHWAARWRALHEGLQEVGAPLVVCVLGVGCGIAAVWVALLSWVSDGS